MSKIQFIRPQGAVLLKRLREPRRFIQVVTGARQVGKTTLVHQIAGKSGLLVHFAGADDPALAPLQWIKAEWEQARLLLSNSQKKEVVLILDEIQKIPQWAHCIKKLWDEDTRHQRAVKLVLLGSAPLLIGQGLTESLAGRFEVLHLPHWSFLEMKKAFGWTLNQYIFFGAYPGAVSLIKDPNRWRKYVRDSLVETAISRDVLLMSNVRKPALLRQLFELSCSYSGQIFSYNKMTGQLQDAGNTTTLAHYLNLLSGAGLVAGLRKYTSSFVQQTSSSPKLQILNTALMTSALDFNLNSAKADKALWGRIVESAVGAHLVNTAIEHGDCKVFYWRDHKYEVDFVLQKGKKITAVEIKSGFKQSFTGIKKFSDLFSVHRVLAVGGGGISVEKFLSSPAGDWVS